MPITSQSECSTAAALLALSDTTASNDGHRLRRQDVFVAPLGHDNDENDCDANVQTEYFCASRATPEACRTDISIGMQCSYDCCGIGVNYHPPYCCETDLPLAHPPRPAPRLLYRQKKCVCKPRTRASTPRDACRSHGPVPPCAVLCSSPLLVFLDEESTVAVCPQWSRPKRRDHSCSKLDRTC